MSPTSPRVALYARVSTAEQHSEAQIADLTGYAGRMGWTISPELVFRDDGLSGLSSRRPGLDALRVAVRERRVDIVLAVKIDRLGRSVRGVLDFYDLADTAGVRVVCTSQGFDTSTASGRLLRDVLASVATFERELIVERTHAGLRRAKAAGKRLGRPRVTVTPETLREIVALRDSGRSWREIAQHVRIKTATVRRLYRGVSKTVGSASPPSDPTTLLDRSLPGSGATSSEHNRPIVTGGP